MRKLGCLRACVAVLHTARLQRAAEPPSLFVFLLFSSPSSPSPSSSSSSLSFFGKLWQQTLPFSPPPDNLQLTRSFRVLRNIKIHEFFSMIPKI
jgi:hypothetical protein